jgi:hypothetical protein
MAQHQQLDEVRMRRIEAALGPYTWTRRSVRAVAQRLVEEIAGDVADPDDVRVWVVEQALSVCRWRSLTVAGLARQAEVALEMWHVSCRRLELELAWLLASDG